MRHALLLTLVLVGCRQQTTPLANPFLGPNRVPPPGTRTPLPGTAVPYYDGTSVPSALPSGGAMLSPPGSGPVAKTEQGSGALATNARAETAPNTRASTAAGTPAPPDPAEQQIAVPEDDHRERLVQLASHEGEDRSSDWASAPRPFPDIGDLPPINSSSSRTARQSAPSRGDGDQPVRDSFRARGGGRVREQPGDVETASFEAPAAAPSPPAAERTARSETKPAHGRQRYDYAPDYTSLKGRLEFSRSAQQWKLRYIPIDGETDEFGGSVVLANPEILGDLAAGDFVHVRGSLLERQKDETSFAPRYRAEHIQPLPD